MTEDMEYNLLREKWIVVKYLDGTTNYVSLTDVFKEAHKIKGLAGELPTQDLAILRVLLAVVYAIYLRQDADGKKRIIADSDDAIIQWKLIWDKQKFEPALIDSYFSKYEARFYLFHSERPFFQAPIKVGTNYSAAKLNSEVSESGNKHRLFVPLGGSNKTNMTNAQAARWLIHAVAFDDASAKQKDKSNGSVQMSTGWLGQIGPVYAEGNNLFETLMLNFVLTDEYGEVMADGHPIWEEEAIRVGERTVMPVPESPAELLTMQSRRILLTRKKNGMIDGYDVVGGDIVSHVNALIEQMTSWKNDKEKNGWMPKRLREDVSMWRDYSSLMIRTKGNTDTFKIPGTVRWLRDLNEHELIPFKSIRLRSTGMTYGSMFSSIQNIIDDSLSINTKLLSEMNDIWNVRISKAIETIGEGVKQIGSFQTSLLECNGYKNDDKAVAGRSNYAKGDAYYRIDTLFRKWLAGIDPETDDIEESICDLYSAVRDILLRMGREMMDNVNSTAMAGKERISPSNGSKYRVNAFKSFSKFERSIYETFRSVTEDGNQQ